MGLYLESKHVFSWWSFTEKMLTMKHDIIKLNCQSNSIYSNNNTFELNATSDSYTTMFKREIQYF